MSNDDGDVVLTTSTGDASTGEVTTNVSTVTGLMTTSTTADASTSGGATDSEGSSTTTGEQGFCGDGVAQGDEECDDGNQDDDDECLSTCKLATCGDGKVLKGVEECDDGNGENSDSCTNECKEAFCGDGYQYLGFEECDDGNILNSDACTDECVEAVCGDGYVYKGEELCDDGVNAGNYEGCAPGCKSFGPHCGDAVVQDNEGERCDTNPPQTNVTCNQNCTYNFSKATQLYCFAKCTWDDVDGCQKADADLFCQLKLGSPTAKAKSFNPAVNVGPPTNGSGFGCAHVAYFIDDGMGKEARQNLGELPEYGVYRPVMWVNKNLLDTHGPGDTIKNVECID
ncbi:MAG: DUF4215 domain-containing protein [Myxococcales bacterium]|nr:DUF4215 domain-containing protein [Myxococcales bacterium]